VSGGCSTYNLEKSEVSDEDVVERYVRHIPRVVVDRLQLETLTLVVDFRDVDEVTECIETSAVLATEQVDSHDAEDKPEHHADDQHVHD